MLGLQHRLFGSLTGASYAAAVGYPLSMVVLHGLAASATANGSYSPDMDQSKTWRRVTRLLPSQWSRHRGLSHWPELPFLAFLAAPNLPADARWVAYAFLLGWVSHIVGDAIFGKIPVLFGNTYVGLGLETGGGIETGLVKRLLVVAHLALLLVFWPAGTQALAAVLSAAASTVGR